MPVIPAFAVSHSASSGRTITSSTIHTNDHAVLSRNSEHAVHCSVMAVVVHPLQENHHRSVPCGAAGVTLAWTRHSGSRQRLPDGQNPGNKAGFITSAPGAIPYFLRDMTPGVRLHGICPFRMTGERTAPVRHLRRIKKSQVGQIYRDAKVDQLPGPGNLLVLIYLLMRVLYVFSSK